MGTRSGDLDPAIIEFIAAKEGLSTREIETLMNKHSGLLGISGLTSDMRELLAEAREENDRRSELAIEIFCYRARKYIGAYLAAMNGADAVVFTGGIGENSPDVRARICNGLQWIGIELHEELNRLHTGYSVSFFSLIFLISMSPKKATRLLRQACAGRTPCRRYRAT